MAVLSQLFGTLNFINGSISSRVESDPLSQSYEHKGDEKPLADTCNFAAQEERQSTCHRVRILNFDALKIN